MASKLIKIAALERLAEIIASAVPDLRGRCFAGPSTKDRRADLPNLTVLPESLRFIGQQPDEHDYLRLDGDGNPTVREPVPGSPIFRVGSWVGTVRLELGADNPPARYRLEHLVEQVFLGSATGVSPLIGDPGFDERPGTLLVDLPNVANLYGARCSFTMDDDAWQNEKAFTSEWFSWLRLDTELPVYVARQGVPTMTDLRLRVGVGSVAQLDDLEDDATTLAVDSDGNVTVP